MTLQVITAAQQPAEDQKLRQREQIMKGTYSVQHALRQLRHHLRIVLEVAELILVCIKPARVSIRSIGLPIHPAQDPVDVVVELVRNILKTELRLRAGCQHQHQCAQGEDLGECQQGGVRSQRPLFQAWILGAPDLGVRKGALASKAEARGQQQRGNHNQALDAGDNEADLIPHLLPHGVDDVDALLLQVQPVVFPRPSFLAVVGVLLL
eukprot:CAMPEP_0204210762 /NCGR_PEP_ID=MMETSP0361-20130328/74166_1 /ASSEMBLY_ACC=CAM_ASM_000343 /TAXON_ID=268821 /ORGANISM="Scrippsiella Hangoei, Strain SHTV-5" /LENGTH=208 /DNA_ID=CAMNT_0051174943 /DNA_START=133 /DNA_END=758 /DNA_ORIENTATION=-